MKTQLQKPTNTVPFSAISVGDLFSVNDDLWMKIDSLAMAPDRHIIVYKNTPRSYE